MSEQQEYPDVIEEFIERKYKDKEETWAATCRRAAHAWHEWVQYEGLDLDNHTIDAIDIEDFRNWIKDNNDYSKSTVSNQVMAARELIRYGYSRHGWDAEFGDQPNSIMDVEVSTKTRRFEEETGVEIPYVSEEQHEAVLDECTNPRDRRVFEVLWDTGCRPSEIRNLTVDDYDYSERELTIDTLKRENHTRKVYVTPTTNRLLGEWVHRGERQAYSSHATTSDYLFPTKRSGQMGQSTINRQLDRWATRAGVQEVAYTKKAKHKMPWRDDEWEETEVEREFKVITAKGYRHSVARRAVLNGASLGVIASILGHSSPDSLKHYIKAFGSDEQKDAFDEFL